MKFIKFNFLTVLICFFSSLQGQEIDSFAPVARLQYTSANNAKLKLIPRNFFEMRAIAKSGLIIKTLQIVDENGKASNIEKVYELDTPKSSEWLVAKTNKQVAAMAGAIFSTFKGTQTDEFLSIRERINFQNNLHLFAITASSYSWEAAKLANMGVDLELKKGATYKITYELKRPNKFCPNKRQTIMYAVVEEPDEKVNLMYIPGDRYLNLKWAKIDHYFAFDIERKLDKNWEKLNSEPILPSSGNDSLNPFFHVVADSTQKNYQFNSYRIFGYNVFGDRKLITNELINAYSRDLTPPPAVSKLTFTSQSVHHVELNWTLNPVEDLRKIRVYYGTSNHGPFKLIGELSSSARSFKHDSASNVLENYYIISTVDTASNEGPTLPFSAITLDTIPPPIMSIKSININPMGIVKIIWNPLSIADLGGYRLSRNFENPTQWSAITAFNLKDTIYYDTLPIKSINGVVYYGIKASDLRGNLAYTFVPYKATPPDVIAPSKPLIHEINSLENGHTMILIHMDETNTKWIQLRRRELIQRKPMDWGNWIQMPATTQIEDTSAQYGKWYEYQIRCVDETGNISLESNTFGQKTVKKPINLKSFNIIAKQETSVSIKMKWNKPLDDRITRLEIFRSIGNQPETLVTSIEIKKLEFTDLGAPRIQFCKYRFNLITGEGQIIPYPNTIEILMQE